MSKIHPVDVEHTLMMLMLLSIVRWHLFQQVSFLSHRRKTLALDCLHMQLVARPLDGLQVMGACGCQNNCPKLLEVGIQWPQMGFQRIPGLIFLLV